MTRVLLIEVAVAWGAKLLDVMFFSTEQSANAYCIAFNHCYANRVEDGTWMISWLVVGPLTACTDAQLADHVSMEKISLVPPGE